MKLGVPMGIQMSVISVGMMSLQYVVNGLWADAVAAYTVGSRIFGLSQIAMMAFGTTMATYVAQHLGAKSFQRLREGVREGTIASVICGIIIAVVVISLSRPLIGIFLSDPSESIVSNAQRYLFWCCPFLFVLSFLFIFKSGVQALGSGTLALLSGALALAVRFVVAISLADSIGFLAVCLASPVSWVVSTVPLLIAFRVLLKKTKKGDAVHAVD